MKHTPATPLPWKFGELSESIIAERSQPIADIDYAKECIGDVDAAANASYLVHAANAYPRLVEALRWHITGKGTPDLDGEKGRALLRSLGEL